MIILCQECSLLEAGWLLPCGVLGTDFFFFPEVGAQRAARAGSGRGVGCQKPCFVWICFGIGLRGRAELHGADEKRNSSTLPAALLNALQSLSGPRRGIGSGKVLLAWDPHFYFQKQLCFVSMFLTVFLVF